MNDNTIKTGGEFLVKDVDYKDIFIPEEFGEEENMILQTCYDFLDAEVIPNLEKIDKQENNIMRTLIEKAGGNLLIKTKTINSTATDAINTSRSTEESSVSV